jgi:hypothetical protein
MCRSVNWFTEPNRFAVQFGASETGRTPRNPVTRRPRMSTNRNRKHPVAAGPGFNEMMRKPDCSTFPYRYQVASRIGGHPRS